MAEIDIGNNIEYDVRPYLFKKAKVKSTRVKLKGLELNLSSKDMLAKTT